MPISSMTGFAGVKGSRPGFSWAWEVRSVNGRSLELRLRLPPGQEALEPRVREAVARRLARGNCQVALTLDRDQPAARIRINEAAAVEVAEALKRVASHCGLPPPSADAVLSVRGVVETVEETDTPETLQALQADLIADFEHSLAALAADRAREGARLAEVLVGQLASIEALVGEAERSPHRSPERIRERLQQQVGKLLGSAPGLDEARLHQEAVLIATRADFEEEVQRLRSHIVAGRELLAAAEPVGRKLDFLSQEFNREANTLCSKAGDPELTRIGLALKAVIDQMREQVQNIE